MLRKTYKNQRNTANISLKYFGIVILLSDKFSISLNRSKRKYYLGGGGKKVWISKKKWKRLEKRIADLEMKIQSQQEEISSHKYPYKALKKAFEEASHQK